MHAESSPTIAMRSTVLEFVPELLYLNEVLVVIFVLFTGLVPLPESINDVPDLKILSRYLDVIEPGVLEVDQIVTQEVE